ncbi:MAG: ASKHA domain-containing protein [Clostridiales bacterium]
MVEKITVFPEGAIHEYQPGMNLSQLLHSLGFKQEYPCGGRGTCGKCRIKIKGDQLPAAEISEARMLTDEELKAGIRLACLVQPKGDVTVWLEKAEEKCRILAEGRKVNLELAPAVGRLRFSLPSLQPADKRSYEEILLAAEPEINSISPLAIQAFNPEPNKAYVAHIYDGRVMDIEGGTAGTGAFGLALDIGTTTVVAALVDLHTGEELALQSMMNGQKEYGLDVLTRITYTAEHENGLEILHKTIIRNINALIERLCYDSGIQPHEIYDIAVSANNVMLHLLLNISPASLGLAPFTPVFCKGKSLPARDIGLLASAKAMVYCLPSIHSYVGADVVAGIYVCQLKKETGKALLMDIGTNGEMALFSHGRILTCSCAAGPALEGMNISCGMRGSEGALESLSITPEGVRLNVIGGGEPRGLCGSGVLSAVSELLRVKLILQDGRIAKPEEVECSQYRWMLEEVNGKKAVKLATGIYITQSDIRQVQLAKGALLAGFSALLEQGKIAVEDLDKVFIAGQFGAHLPVESLVGCGILPAALADKIHYAGNSSKNGAYAALLSVKARQEMEDIAAEKGYFDLNMIPGFQTLFIKCLPFP